MKTGRDLKDLLAEVIRQDESKRDFVAPTQAMQLVPTKDNGVRLTFGDQNVGIKDIAHNQIASHTGIPRTYYDKMRTEAPALLANNVNEWFSRYPTDGKSTPRMVRTLDEHARAFVSDRFRTLDNSDLLQAALPKLLDRGVEVMSCDVTESKLYLKVVDSRIKRDLPDGSTLGKGHVRFNTVSPALVLSNSEVGHGALSVQTSVWEGGCTNLMVINERSKRHFHVGGKHEIGDEVYAMLSNTTKRITDAALWATIGDVVIGAFDQARFDATCEKLTAASQDPINGDPIKVVEVTADMFGLHDGERNSVLKHFLQRNDLTRYGLQAAITRAAEDVASYDRASDLEVMGGKIIELPRTDFARIAQAA